MPAAAAAAAAAAAVRLRLLVPRLSVCDRRDKWTSHKSAAVVNVVKP